MLSSNITANFFTAHFSKVGTVYYFGGVVSVMKMYVISRWLMLFWG